MLYVCVEKEWKRSLSNHFQLIWTVGVWAGNHFINNELTSTRIFRPSSTKTTTTTHFTHSFTQSISSFTCSLLHSISVDVSVAFCFYLIHLYVCGGWNVYIPKYFDIHNTIFLEMYINTKESVVSFPFVIIDSGELPVGPHRLQLWTFHCFFCFVFCVANFWYKLSLYLSPFDIFVFHLHTFVSISTLRSIQNIY